MADRKTKANPELQILKDLIELDQMECPMILVTVEGEHEEESTNCPRGKAACLCAKLPGEKITVRVPGESD